MIKNVAQNWDEVGRILDTSLELIASGSANIESILDRYPEFSEQLRPPLEAAMWLQTRKEVFNPRPGFVKLSQRRMVNRFRGQESAAGVNETISRIPAIFQERRIAVQYSALLTLTAVLLFVGYQSTSFLVQRSIPGDPLYEAKLVQEELRVNLASNQEDETRLRIEFAQRRVIEIQELVLVGRSELIDDAMTNFEFQLSQAASGILIVAKSDQIKAAQLSTLFEQTLTVPVNNLVGIIDSNPELVSGGFIDKFLTLASEAFDDRPFEFVMVAATSTSTSTATLAFTPTDTLTATFTSTSTIFADPTSTVQDYDSLPSTAVPTQTNTSVPRVEPTATATFKPTSAPPPTDPPPATQAPTPTDDSGVEPTPQKTKRPKPTQHPTYRPTDGN